MTTYTTRDRVEGLQEALSLREGRTAARYRPGSDTRLMRPLLIAEAANLHWPSVPLVGWNLSRAIAGRTNALVVTQVRNRDVFLEVGLKEGRDFISIDNEQVARAFHRFGERIRGGHNRGWTTVTALSSLAYYSFEKEVMRVLGDRLVAGEFDLVHRITPLTPTSQSMIAHYLERLGIPFVIGPLNGGTRWPVGFDSVRRREGDWMTPVRELYRLMPAYRATRSKAAAIFVGSKAGLEQLPQASVAKAQLLPENGVDPQCFPYTERSIRGQPLRVAFIGRLVPYKGADILIEALAQCPADLGIEADILGDGPERVPLEELVKTRGLEDRIRFTGWVPHSEFASKLSRSHVLALPSVREFGGGVVLEAMALGLVPIVADHGGPPELIDPDCGIAVQFHDRESLISGFAQAFMSLVRQPSLLPKLSAKAGSKVLREYTWDAKAAAIIETYRGLLAAKYPTAPGAHT